MPKRFFDHHGLISFLFDVSFLSVQRPSSSQLFSGFCLVAEAPQLCYLADDFYHVISRTSRLQVKNDTNGLHVSITALSCQGCLLRLSGSSTLTSNHGDLFLPQTLIFVEPGPSRSLQLSNSHFLGPQSLIPYLPLAPIWTWFCLAKLAEKLFQAYKWSWKVCPASKKNSVVLRLVAHSNSHFYPTIRPSTGF